MLTTTVLPRVFTLNDKGQDITLADPSQSFSPEAVLNFYAQAYPILATATIEGPVIADDALQFKFLTQIGTKG